MKFEKEIAPFVHLSDVSIDEKRIHDGIYCAGEIPDNPWNSMGKWGDEEPPRIPCSVSCNTHLLCLCLRVAYNLLQLEKL